MFLIQADWIPWLGKLAATKSYADVHTRTLQLLLGNHNGAGGRTHKACFISVQTSSPTNLVLLMLLDGVSL
jgi:hypothetical protein